MKYTLLLFMACILSCGRQQPDDKHAAELAEVNEREFTASPAPEWSDLFLRKSGWIGGDGIFAIPLSGKDSNRV
jgi:hypothetical protein